MPVYIIKILFLAFFLVSFQFSPAQANLSREIHSLNQYHFAVPHGLESKVNFWKKIYSEYSTSHAVIHDMNNLDVIYEVVYLKNGPQLSRRTRERRLKRTKQKYRKILLQLARTRDISKLKSEARRVYNLFSSKNASTFRRAARKIRTQIGQKDRFKEGLERSGMFNDRINQIFREYKLPASLAVLPHVESSFQVNAYSSAGAAGIWQFTRGTGRLFMKVGYDVDERRDPILSTVAAAKLLKKNFEVLKSWPLAITAYNHGTQGMRRAQKRYGSNIVDIINGYRSRTFGFASENFYAEFLAAKYVVANQEKYFPGLKMAKPRSMASVRFQDYFHINSIMSHFGMTRDEVSKYNPALRNPVISGQKYIPRGFTFQAPAEKYPNLSARYRTIPVSARHKSQVRSKWYTVRRGDTLSEVARRFRVSVEKLYRYNNLSHRNKIYIGQVLRLPGRGTVQAPRVRMAKASPSRKKYTGETMDYRVRRNDNLTKIARRFDTNVRELSRLNGIRNPNRLYPGQSLKVPHEAVVAQAVNIARTAPSTGTSSVKKERLVLKVDRSREKKRARLKSADSKAEIRFVNNTQPLDEVNKNRPAFLPVAFAGTDTHASRIGIITVDFDETLSHYADWAGLPISKILRLNNMRSRSRLNIHSKIKVSFTKVDPDVFEERRQEYHKAIQEDFFNNYRINKLLVRNVVKGETVWEICNEIYFIPFWLLASYNPEKEIDNLAAGEPIVIPIISPIKAG
ncbi:MAG: LysM peptidoglycan-binding domain-containing protein [Nitrospinae bacterium]|nr:LysM peptidoglycan-binding domain-containing protein [Nitrospinota bacterium]